MIRSLIFWNLKFRWYFATCEGIDQALNCSAEKALARNFLKIQYFLNLIYKEIIYE